MQRARRGEREKTCKEITFAQVGRPRRRKTRVEEIQSISCLFLEQCVRAAERRGAQFDRATTRAAGKLLFVCALTSISLAFPGRAGPVIKRSRGGERKTMPGKRSPARQGLLFALPEIQDNFFRFFRTASETFPLRFLHEELFPLPSSSFFSRAFNESPSSSSGISSLVPPESPVMMMLIIGSKSPISRCMDLAPSETAQFTLSAPTSARISSSELTLFRET